MLLAEDHDGVRLYRDTATGRTAISVTARAKQALQEGDTYAYTDPLHALEGEGGHTVALNWLAFHHHWVDTFTMPVKPAAHPDERRWDNVMANALIGAQEWFDNRQVVPLAIEQPSANWRWGVAGCPDLLCELTWKKRRVVALVELKFTAALILAHRVQLRLYRCLDGYRVARMGFLVRISRDTGQVEERPVFWDENPELDARALGGK